MQTIRICSKNRQCEHAFCRTRPNDRRLRRLGLWGGRFATPAKPAIFPSSQRTHPHLMVLVAPNAETRPQNHGKATKHSDSTPIMRRSCVRGQNGAVSQSRGRLPRTNLRSGVAADWLSIERIISRQPNHCPGRRICHGLPDVTAPTLACAVLESICRRENANCRSASRFLPATSQNVRPK